MRMSFLESIEPLLYAGGALLVFFVVMHAIVAIRNPGHSFFDW